MKANDYVQEYRAWKDRVNEPEPLAPKWHKQVSISGFVTARLNERGVMVFTINNGAVQTSLLVEPSDCIALSDFVRECYYCEDRT